MDDGSDVPDSYTAISDALVRLAAQAVDRPTDVIDPVDRDYLLAAIAWEGSPKDVLHLWRLALSLCASREFVAGNEPVFAEAVRGIGAELLERRTLPGTLVRTAGLLVLEELIHAAIVVDEPQLAALALRQLRARTSELFLTAGLGPAFLAMRPISPRLVDAAHLAFDEVAPELAVEIAEAGRVKLLSAVAAGSPTAPPDDRTPAASWASIELTRETHDAVVAVLTPPNAEAIRDLVRMRLDDDQLAAVLVRLVEPWERLIAAGDDIVAAEVPDELWDGALVEPTVAWMTAQLADDQMLVYTFVDDERIGFILVFSFGVSSLIVRGRDVREERSARANRQAGTQLADTIETVLDHLDFTGDRPGDVRFVAWDPDNELAVQQIATGFWTAGESSPGDPEADDPPVPRHAAMLMASARGLATLANPRPPGPPATTFLGDPTGDLGGPWVEAIAWRTTLGERASILMGSQATCSAALTALSESDVVVISGHTVGTAGDEAFAIGLADGVLSHSDLLARRKAVRASMVVLSCCAAAATLDGPARVELLGLVTSLLALGVQQVLAPLVPVYDRPAGVVGAAIAAEVAEGADLRQALAAATGHNDPSRPCRASTELPPEWADACPHELTPYGVVGSVPYMQTLRELTVFGGGSARASGQARSPNASA